MKNKTLNEFLDSLNERNVEITKPSAVDKWGLKVEIDGKQTTFQEVKDPTWQAAIKEVIAWIRKNLNYEDFQEDKMPVDLQFKADGTVIITSDKQPMEFQGKQVPSVTYRLSTGIAGKMSQLLGATK
jgi:hypothetical protein